MSTTADREKGSAALTSVIGALFLTGMKIVVGIMTGSLGILSEAAHSALDLVAAVVTLFAVRFSGRPADEQHPYGHGKIENLSALFETVLLLITCAWIIYEAINRLFFKDVPVEVNIWSFLTMGVSIVIDISRSRVLMRAAKKYSSQALEADALHFSTDVWSSSVVICGLALVLISQLTGAHWLIKADAFAALVVAMIVVYVSVQLGKRTIDGLLDTAPEGVSQAIAERVRAIPGVENVSGVRVRRSGAETFADVTISVGRSLLMDEAQSVALAVQDAVRTTVPNTDIMVHTVAHDDVAEDILRHVRLVAGRMRLGVHNLAVQKIGENIYVGLDLEVPPELSLGQAHGLASKLENQLRQEIPTINRIDTHIEPRPQIVETGRDATAQSGEVIAAVKAAIGEMPLITGYHNITVLQSDDHLDVSVHCTFDQSVPIRDVHSIADQISQRVKTAIPQVDRVIVHSEP